MARLQRTPMGRLLTQAFKVGRESRLEKKMNSKFEEIAVLRKEIAEIKIFTEKKITELELAMAKDKGELRLSMEKDKGELRLSMEKDKGELKLSMEKDKGELRLSMEKDKGELKVSIVNMNGLIGKSKSEMLTYMMGLGVAIGGLILTFGFGFGFGIKKESIQNEPPRENEIEVDPHA